MSEPEYFKDWPAQEYPQAVEDCIKSLKRLYPVREEDRSYRFSYQNALEQADYLGLSEHVIAMATRGQLDMFEASQSC